ncbi:MAG: polysaccharide biosynthesis protein [Clostridia bacterium]|nr:polysaccharide biosynthesis protein [Clostridia bacterium]
MKKQSFVLGAVLLAISGIFCKLLGAIYKIPLTNILGSQGMGIYYLVFPVYAFLLTLTSSSFTTAVSKSVSSLIAKDKKLYAYKTFKGSLILLCFLGFVAGLFLICFSRVIATLQGLENAFICYISIAPSILFVAISSSFKGYFQGLQNMTPTALSQILEQIIKLCLGFLLAKLLCQNGVVYGTLGALVGVTLSEATSCLFFIIYFLIFKNKNKAYFKFLSASEEEKSVPLKTIVKQVFKGSIPFTLSSIILPMSLVVDSFLIINILKSMQFDKVFATSLLGLNSGIVNTLIGLPSTLSVAICMTIVPYISFALSQKDFEGINKKTSLALKLTMLVAIPCVFVFVIFSPQILKLLYSSSFQNNYEYNVACSLLTVSAINVLYLSILQISTSLLQAVNKAYIPVASLAFALIIKVLCEVLLINNPYLNICGAILSNAICYIVSAAINIFNFRKEFNLKFSFYQTVVCPIVSSLTMSCVIFLSLKIMQTFLSYNLSVLLSFVLGFVMYLVLLFVMKTFSEEEVKSLLFFKKKKGHNRI